MKKTLWLGCCLAVALSLTGCPRETSCNIKTDGIFSAFQVVDQDGVVKATALFTVGNAVGTALALGSDCGDKISVNGTPLQEKQGVAVYYEGTVTRADTYEFKLEREGEGPFVSTVSSVPVLTVTAPAAGTEVSRMVALDVAWEDNGDTQGTVNLWIHGPYIEPFLEDITDDGAYTVSAETIEATQEDTCDATLVLTREVFGDLDPGLTGGGLIAARSVAETWFKTLP